MIAKTLTIGQQKCRIASEVNDRQGKLPLNKHSSHERPDSFCHSISVSAWDDLTAL
jgi:hypothetical protein